MSEKRKFAKRILLIVLICLSIPAFYVLSIGPAVLIFEKFQLRGHWTGSALTAFYSPLISYAEKKQDYTAHLLVSYVEMWDDP